MATNNSAVFTVLFQRLGEESHTSKKQPASDVAENLGRFLVRSVLYMVHARGVTLNWFQR